MKHQIKEEISGITLFVSAIWVIFLVDLVLPVDFNNLGLIPRDLWGSAGIFTMPFLHGGWGHLIGNSIPLIILLCLLAGSQANSAKIVLQIIILGGVLLWLFGLPGKTHVGASGLIYGLIINLVFGLAGGLFRCFSPKLDQQHRRRVALHKKAVF